MAGTPKDEDPSLTFWEASFGTVYRSMAIAGKFDALYFDDILRVFKRALRQFENLLNGPEPFELCEGPRTILEPSENVPEHSQSRHVAFW